MFSWIGRFLSSSVGKKTLMALTGLCLVGFLAVHLLGNLSLYAGGKEGFNKYAESLESLGGLLRVAELGLLALFVVHIGLALRVVRENNLARTERYKVRASMGNKTAASSTMLITGLLVLGFLIVHIIDFRVPTFAGEMPDLGDAVVKRLGAPVGATIYMVGVIALGLHLRHAIGSAFQTLGLNHPRWSPLLKAFGLGLAALLTLGFATFPLYCIFANSGGY